MFEFVTRRNRVRFTTVSSPLIALLVLFVVSAGCSKEARDKMATSIQETGQNLADRTKEYASGAAAAVEEQLPETGNFNLLMSPGLKTDKAQVRVISIGDGRPNVVQIASYDFDNDNQVYPRVYVQGSTSALTPALLSGQAVNCSIFMQASGSAPILAAAPGKTVRVVFNRYDANEQTIEATVGRGQLLGSDDVEVALNGGAITAVVIMSEEPSEE